jgi:hypothetical protein
MFKLVEKVMKIKEEMYLRVCSKASAMLILYRCDLVRW